LVAKRVENEFLKTFRKELLDLQISEISTLKPMIAYVQKIQSIAMKIIIRLHIKSTVALLKSKSSVPEVELT